MNGTPHELPMAESRLIKTPVGSAIGISHRWEAGQYCAILTRKGLLGCGIYDLACADEFHFAFALAKGTPERPLVEPEDLLSARVVKVSQAAREMGMIEGMTGQEALEKLLLAEQRPAVAAESSVH
ncbi:YunC family protein [bacterium]|nr:YunC family protein [bacterium]